MKRRQIKVTALAEYVNHKEFNATLQVKEKIMKNKIVSVLFLLLFSVCAAIAYSGAVNSVGAFSCSFTGVMSLFGVYDFFVRPVEPETDSSKNMFSLMALILGIICVAITIFEWFAPTQGNEWIQVGAMIGKALVIPSAVCMVVAVLLNAIGYFTVSRATTLISAIFYILSLALMPFWGFIGIPSMILQFVAFAKMKNVSK